jgi:sucrose-6F-phosphate phosphohydrolase
MKYILVCDLDETLTGDKKGIKKFNEIISSNKEKFYLVYSSGRFKNSIISVIEGEELIQPDVIISNLGTEIYYLPNWNIDEEWEKIIGKNWNKEKIALILGKFDLRLQPYNKKFVIPCYLDNKAIIIEIKEKMKDCKAKVIYTKNRFLDIIPENAGKGNASKYLGNKMNLPIICCGDSENDEDMLKKSKYGILVGNAPIDLKRKLSKHSNIHIAKSPYARGVIEGLKTHGII